MKDSVVVLETAKRWRDVILTVAPIGPLGDCGVVVATPVAVVVLEFEQSLATMNIVS